MQLWEEVYVRMRAGATVQARFHLSVEPGYFVVAGGIQGSAQLRPLTLRIKQAPEVQLGKPAYPAPTANASIPGLPPFTAYEGTIAVSLPITASAKASASTRVLEGVLEYQACTATGCAEPAALPVSIEVEVRQ